jgi:Concanavalin A-like lectin/glucanases superfamily
MFTSPWRSKPWPGVGIDRTNPLAQGLRFAFPFNEGSGLPYEIVEGIAPTTHSNYTWGSGLDGSAITLSNAPVFVYPIPALTPFNGITVLVRFAFSSLSGTQRFLVSFPSGQNWELLWSGTAFQWYGASIRSNTGTLTSSVPVGTWHTVVASDDLGSTGINCPIYLDGVNQQTGHASNAAPANSASSLYVGSGGSGNLVGSMSLALIWNRVLTANEVVQITANPWQVFAPAWPWAPVKSAAGVRIFGSRTMVVSGPAVPRRRPRVMTIAKILPPQTPGIYPRSVQFLAGQRPPRRGRVWPGSSQRITAPATGLSPPERGVYRPIARPRPPAPGRLLRWPGFLFSRPPVWYHVYANTGAGDPINYVTPVATVNGLTWTSSPLSYAGNWKFAVRAFYYPNGLEEQNLDCEIELILDSGGNDITNRPVAPTGLRALAVAGGNIKIEWSYPNPPIPAQTPTGFHVYSGVGSLSYATPTQTVSYGSSIMNTFTAILSGLTNGTTYMIGVRAFNATAEEPNTATVTCTSDATGPTAVQSLTAVAV